MVQGHRHTYIEVVWLLWHLCEDGLIYNSTKDSWSQRRIPVFYHYTFWDKWHWWWAFAWLGTGGPLVLIRANTAIREIAGVLSDPSHSSLDFFEAKKLLSISLWELIDPPAGGLGFQSREVILKRADNEPKWSEDISWMLNSWPFAIDFNYHQLTPPPPQLFHHNKSSLSDLEMRFKPTQQICTAWTSKFPCQHNFSSFRWYLNGTSVVLNLGNGTIYTQDVAELLSNLFCHQNR